jgi:hypothetical protein
VSWIRGIVGAILVLLGAVWVGQGLGFIKGSFMTGQSIWALIGIVLFVVGAWLLWSLRTAARTAAK